MDTAVSVELFVEILNRYVYYFEQENDAVSTSLLTNCIDQTNQRRNKRSPRNTSTASSSSSTPTSRAMTARHHWTTRNAISRERWITLSRVTLKALSPPRLLNQVCSWEAGTFNISPCPLIIMWSKSSISAQASSPVAGSDC